MNFKQNCAHLLYLIMVDKKYIVHNIIFSCKDFKVPFCRNANFNKCVQKVDK